MTPVTPLLKLFATGGTIASRPNAGTGAVSVAMTGEELLTAHPALAEVARCDVVSVAAVNGWNITPSLMMTLAAAIDRALADPAVTGAIITHGTDTVEETLCLLDLVLATEKPVVAAVALRHSAELGADGPRNLLDAARVAVAPSAVGRGPLLVVNQAIHAARDVTKTHTTDLGAFESATGQPEGFIGPDGTVWFTRRPRRTRRIPTERIEPDVFLFKATAGVDARPLAWAIEAGFRGIVIEGSGAGNVPATVVPGIEAAIAQQIPVVLTTRCPRGSLAPIYGGGGGAGGGADLMRLGVIPADGLPSQKARVVLMVALGAGLDRDALCALFAGYAMQRAD